MFKGEEYAKGSASATEDFERLISVHKDQLNRTYYDLIVKEISLLLDWVTSGKEPMVLEARLGYVFRMSDHLENLSEMLMRAES